MAFLTATVPHLDHVILYSPKSKTEGTARINPPEALCTFILPRIISTPIIILAARLFLFLFLFLLLLYKERETVNHHANPSLESIVCTHSRLSLSVTSPFLYILYIVASYIFFSFSIRHSLHCYHYFHRSFVRSSVGGREELSLSLSPLIFLLSIIIFVHSV